MLAVTHFYGQRLKKIQKNIAINEAILVVKPTDITHFTGFPQLVPEEREALLCITNQKAFLFHHSFSPTITDFSELTYIPQTNLKKLQQTLEQENIKILWLDEQNLTAEEFRFLQNHFTGKLETCSTDFFWKYRLEKDELAMVYQQKAGQIIAHVLETIPQFFHNGITEKQLAGKIIGLMMELGAEGPAFPTIVAFGENGALPHHQPTDKTLKSEMPVLIDAGAKFNSYRSDMTRTYWFGQQPTTKFLEIEEIIKTAYKKAEETIKLGPNSQEVVVIDQAARKYIEQQGYGEEFIHTTGHGIGLDIHEPPSVSWMNHTALKAGITFTIEPGIYLKNEFGYRHENTVHLTENSFTVLTKI
ncbi:MAG: hypothetical protein COU63_03970 [Candidatus Pacebacteria bacterium CG10_big_fil_rev_8_21_14_0_10_36_11]|nr:M24 family metallopeptidase [Candidatus Pacearchaeota archaeon]OIP74054.1 MAG: hypothetical protein AUK08_02245 [Candidatus Pacebacteria bacterium CG2_30_36_39]PIR64421.1 MAG: hypothetical protein COU63_03970 [Candidatus Pacebacteria bacterium CG10_big_fil_rev_8_21_14_0_10_36_11]PJC43176.1 MAG: hypothetical protein CO040_00590 [Candidatus Pacebacteria bacterium CG_4_9_14_0_2_um_filter_36_8]